MRKIERHHSNDGSVIYYSHFGKPSKLFVADARWRYFTSIAPSSQLILSSRAFSGKRIWGHRIISGSERWLWKQFAQLKGDFSAKENTDLLMMYGSDAALRCRILASDDLGPLDLPTLYQLMVIYQEADRIDVLDPTIDTWSKASLGYKDRFNPKFEFEGYHGAWSSTIVSDVKFGGLIISLDEFCPCVLGNAFALDHDGFINVSASNDQEFCVIPVKEIPV